MQPRSKYNYQYCLALNAKQVCIYFIFLAQVEFYFAVYRVISATMIN